MSKRLKGVIFSINNVLIPKGGRSITVEPGIERLLQFLLKRDLQPVVFANHEQRLGSRNLEEIVTDRVGAFPWFIALRDRLPLKPTVEAMPYILDRMGWDATEAVYIGSSKADMLTALHGDVLFLNAAWFAEDTTYGIKFDSPRDVGRFIDIFCLRDSLWHYAITDKGFEYYSLAPFSTFKTDFAVYSNDAKESAKFGAGHPDFWTKYLWSTIYFSELYKRVDFVTPYPGHKASSVSTASNVLEDPMLAFTKCFRIEYLRNLIIRHTTATKSQTARNQGRTVDHCNQLNTIHLNLSPLKGDGKKTLKPGDLEGKTVLVVDDFCTQGNSLEAARVYLKRANANAISLSWLKTINTDYCRIRRLEPSDFNPFEINTFSSVIESKYYRYKNHIVDLNAPLEIDARLSAYDNWHFS